ncbi:MAG: nucleotidyltransferase family protein [Desulfobaccales bacterium]
MDIERLLQEKRQEILKIAARHGVRSIRVFGSAARGEAREGSDLDLLIETGPERTPWFPGSLIADLEELLGCRVDVVTEKALHWYIRDRVLAEARPL